MTTAIHLSFKEIWRNRGRFLLFSLVIALITLLILFIAALGEGLGAGNREYIEKLNADLIVYQDTAELAIASSRIGCQTRDALRGVNGVQEVGPIGFSAASILRGAGEEPLDISLIGVDPGRPGEPPVVAGQGLERRNANEAIIDRMTALVTGLQVGDRFNIRSPQGGEEEIYLLKVMGISESQMYAIRPSVFVPIVKWDQIRPQAAPGRGADDPACNVAAVKLQDPTQLEVMVQRLEAQVRNIEAVDITTASRTPLDTPPSKRHSTLRTASPC